MICTSVFNIASTVTGILAGVAILLVTLSVSPALSFLTSIAYDPN